MEQHRLAWLLKPLTGTLLALVLFGMGYWLGLRTALMQVLAGTEPQAGPLRWVQFDPQQQLQPAPDPRELIPLQPGQAEECPLLIYQDGQLFRLELPGQLGPGLPGESPELIPLDPILPTQPAPPGGGSGQST